MEDVTGPFDQGGSLLEKDANQQGDEGRDEGQSDFPLKGDPCLLPPLPGGVGDGTGVAWMTRMAGAGEGVVTVGVTVGGSGVFVGVGDVGVEDCVLTVAVMPSQTHNSSHSQRDGYVTTIPVFAKFWSTGRHTIPRARNVQRIPVGTTVLQRRCEGLHLYGRMKEQP